MKKSKLLKSLGFASLAVLMGFGATMAFAPLGNVAPASLATSQPTDVLVTPQEDDPVLFTTEDGLEIKWGNDTSSAIINSSLGSGNLTGFPYFTTTNGTTTYTWVVIGQNPNTLVFRKPNESYLFSSWKNTHNRDTILYETNAYYFFNNTYETTSPAGAVIDTTISSTSYVSDLATSPIVKTNSEIPSDCVLVLANGNVATGAFATISRSGGGSSSNPYRYRPGTLTMSNAMEGYYTNGSFGLSAIKSSIQSVSMTTKVADNNNPTQTLHVFGLASNTSEKFAYSNYLTAAQGKLTANFWLRSNAGGWSGEHGGSKWAYSINLHYVNTSGAIANSSCSGNPSNGGGGTAPTAGYRPAFVLKLT